LSDTWIYVFTFHSKTNVPCATCMTLLSNISKVLCVDLSHFMKVTKTFDCYNNGSFWISGAPRNLCESHHPMSACLPCLPSRLAIELHKGYYVELHTPYILQLKILGFRAAFPPITWTRQLYDVFSSWFLCLGILTVLNPGLQISYALGSIWLLRVALQGYIVYSVKNKLKKEYLGHPLEKIKALKLSGVQVHGFIKSRFL
jgi:hypothetical protein